MTEHRWITPADLADELRVPLSTVYRWNHQGSGPHAYRIGKHVRYRRSDIEAWLAERPTQRVRDPM